MITAVPPDSPATIPPVSADATGGLPLVHVPPDTALLKLVRLPWHKVFVPVIGAAGAGTVSVAVITQPAIVV